MQSDESTFKFFMIQNVLIARSRQFAPLALARSHKYLAIGNIYLFALMPLLVSSSNQLNFQGSLRSVCLSCFGLNIELAIREFMQALYCNNFTAVVLDNERRFHPSLPNLDSLHPPRISYIGHESAMQPSASTRLNGSASALRAASSFCGVA